MDQAVDLAIKQNLSLASARKRARASHDIALGAGAHLLPSLHLFDLYQRWNCPAAISLQNSAFRASCLSDARSLPPSDLSAFTPAQQAQIAAAVSPFTGPPPILRNENTNLVIVSVNQPLVGLLHRGFEFAAARESEQASNAGVKAAEAEVRQSVQTAVLRLFEARAREQIAAASVAELRQQVEDAQARLKADVITRADLLRVEVAAASVEQQRLEAHADAAVAKARLLDALGLSSTADVDFVEPSTLMAAAAAILPPLGPAAEQALRRPEVVRSERLELAARHTRRARFLSLLPEVDFQGAYTRFDGQFFLPPNQWYAGVNASWTFWEWGATWFPAQAAARLAEAAALDLDNQRRSVKVDVQVALEQTQAAGTAVGVAQKSITSAQEAYKDVMAMVKADTATTTDLLDAQAALTRARLNLSRAQYELAIQHVALVRAMGE